MSLRTTLIELRQSKNWSQAEAATALDVSQPAYNKWESGKAKPTIESLMKIADTYNTDISYLLKDELSQISGDNKNSAICIYGNPVVNNQIPPQVLDAVLKNQEQITLLLEAQNKLITSLISKK